MVLINQQYNKVIMGTRDDEYDYLFKGKSLQIFNLLFSSIPMTFFSLIKLILRFLLPRIYISIVSDTRRTIKRWFFSSTKTFHWKLKFFFWRSRSESKWMMTKYKKIHTYIIYIITLLTIQRDEKKNERRIESLA